MSDFAFAAATALLGVVIVLIGRHETMWPTSRDSLAMTLRGVVVAVGLLFLVLAAVNVSLIERSILFPQPIPQQQQQQAPKP